MKAGDIVEEIRTDFESGAMTLGGRALDALALSKSAAPALLKVRPDLPFIAAVVRFAGKKGVAAARRELKTSLGRLLERARDILPRGGRYIRFGTSGTVDAVLKAVGAKPPGDARPDVALVGADVLLPGGDFINVKGTGDFLRKAGEQGAGVYVVATELKRARTKPRIHKGFELIPGRLVHAILTEKGLHYPPKGTARLIH